ATPTARPYTVNQLAKALEVIATGRIHPILADVYSVRSADGERSYITSPESCGCAAFVLGEGLRCYHRLAVALVVSGLASI
ncbi:hypothetical protein, partial [Nocardiopsis gilva]